MKSILQSERQRLLNRLFGNDVRSVFSLVEGSKSRVDIDICNEFSRIIRARADVAVEQSGAGKSEFVSAIFRYLKGTFIAFNRLRSGGWAILAGEDRLCLEVENCGRFPHVALLAEKAKNDPDLRAALGGDYFIEPDVVVVRDAECEEFINKDLPVADDTVAGLTPIRALNDDGVTPQRLLHASISCKWTIRSDRSQNARTEALNLIRNRNGRVPHIVVITAEPTPKRIASIAQGTSDLDCIYHVALPELREAVAESLEGRRSEQGEDLDYLIAAKRLRDISDLPLDLAI